MDNKDFLKKFHIPVQPAIVLEINTLIDSQNFTLNSVANLISKDVSLSTAVLRVANSSFFSRGTEIDSILKAVNIMGVKNVKLLVLNAVLRNSFVKIDNQLMEKFWRHSELIAVACELIANRFCVELSGIAYMSGLFHDCAVPIFVSRYRDYIEIFDKSLRCSDFDIISEEKNRYSIDHSTVGYHFCKSWNLPELVALGVKYHHFGEWAGTLDNLSLEMLLAILVLSDRVVQSFDVTNINNVKIPLNEWVYKYENLLSLLGVDEQDIFDLKDDFLDKAFSELKVF